VAVVLVAYLVVKCGTNASDLKQEGIQCEQSFFACFLALSVQAKKICFDVQHGTSPIARYQSFVECVQKKGMIKLTMTIDLGPHRNA